MRQTRTIVVAGAGIAGLTASLALSKAGFRVVLLERNATLSDAGAGIQISPNAGRVLAELGLDAAVSAVGSEPTGIEVRSGKSGHLLAALPLAEHLRRRHEMGYRVVHRGDLQRLLLAAARDAEVELHLGSELAAFGVHANGLTVLVSTENGHNEMRASALIAADGVHSHVRRLMPGGSEAEHVGRTAWRAVLPLAEAPSVLAADRIGLWLGADAHLVHYPLRRGTEINVVAIVKDDWNGKGWSAPGDPAWLAKRFQKWAPLPRALLEAVPHWLKWPILSVPPSGTWAAGPVAMIGDAAHAMSPFLAQGGAMAIEDAAVLAAKLAAMPNDPEAALEAYAKERRARVKRIWRAAASNGDLYHMSGISGAVRDFGMRLLGGHGLVSSYDWIYRWRPPEIPTGTVAAE